MAIVLGAPALLTACRGDRGEDHDQAGDVSKGLGAPSGEPIVRVRVRRVRQLRTSVKIGTEDQWLRLHRADAPESDAVLKGPVALSVTARAWRIRDAQGHEPAVEGLETIELSALEQRNALILLDDTQYPGSLTAVAQCDDGGEGRATGFDVVNHVKLERYLPGVLAKELYAHWHPQAFAAQAIASRSFACTEHAYFRDRRHYDLSDTQSSQVYVGATGHGRSQAAVTATRGQVLVYEERLVPGYYSSCCGGLAATAVDAIGSNPVNDTMPLRGRSGQDVCTEAPVYRWARERTKGDMLDRLRGYGKARGNATLESLDRLEAIEVAETNAHGRPNVYRVRDSRDAVAEIDAARLRQALDYTRSGGNPPKDPMWSSFVDVQIDKSAVHVEGCGFGHGVGLCQYGAETLAKSGASFDAIIEWYYPGAKIVTA